MKSLFIFLALLGSFSFSDQTKITVYLIGDSTMSNKEIKAYPETGWGMPFSVFFDSSVVIDNRAKNGRSTRTFLSENLWQPVYENLKEGDYVFIQFGHNDEYKEKTERYTTPAVFKTNLTKFVNDTQSKKATPILLTPVTRRKFNDAGEIQETHPGYSEAVREIARELNVPLIDLDKKSRELLQSLGPEQSKLLFLHLAPGEHPNYPKGKTDDTHFSELGARKVAQIVLAEIKVLNFELANRVVKK